MEIRIKTTDYQMVSEVSDYIDERTAAIERLLGTEADAARMEIEIGRAAGKARHSDYMWFAEIDVRTPGGVHAHASNNEDTINAAIDRAKDEVMAQLRKGKQSNRRHIRKTGTAIKGLMHSDDGE